MTRLKKAKFILILIAIALVVWIAPWMGHCLVFGGLDGVRKLVKKKPFIFTIGASV